MTDELVTKLSEEVRRLRATVWALSGALADIVCGSDEAEGPEGTPSGRSSSSAERMRRHRERLARDESDAKSASHVTRKTSHVTANVTRSDGSPPRPLSSLSGSGSSSFSGESSKEGEEKGEGERARGPVTCDESDANGASHVTANVTRVTASPKASRLPDGWTPKPATLAALTAEGLSPSASLLKFRDHWTAEATKGARKLDWDAAFRNWVRRDGESARDRPSGFRRAAPTVQAYSPPRPGPKPALDVSHLAADGSDLFGFNDEPSRVG